MSLVGCLDHEIGSAPEEWFQRVHPDDSEQVAREIDVIRAEGHLEFELRYRLRHKDGTYRWMCSRGLVIRDEEGEAIRLTGTQADVTVDTVTDEVTALPNRLLLVDRLTQSIERARRHPTFHFALLLIEIGRPAGSAPTSRPGGDRLLNGAARRLETSLRTKDAMSDSRQSDLVARVDGDQFAVLLEGVRELHDATIVAERVLAELLNPFALSSGEVRLSPTVGIALSATGYVHPDEALRDAETALHRARVLGGSHWEVFDAEVLKSQQSARQLEAALEVALPRGEFQLAYQPIVSTATNVVIGFEALVRWHHPTLGTISPLDFIPVAERTGSIVPLGRWILNDACAQLRTWQTTLPNCEELWVSVNLSGVQLREPDLVEQIEEILRRHEIQPRSLVLELTEGVAMDNPLAVTTLLMRLRAIGVRISLDDFGTGYSSLAYLRQFPVDALKIDQSFVRGLANDKDTTVIVSGIMAMARELGLYVVAEGVETAAQRDALQALQCESVQGYFVAKPLDVASATAFLCADVSPPAAMIADAHGTGVWSHLRLEAAWLSSLPRVGRELLVTSLVTVVVLSAGVGTVFYRSHHVQPQVPAHVTAPDPAGVPAVTEPPAPVASVARADAPGARSGPMDTAVVPGSPLARTSAPPAHVDVRRGSALGDTKAADPTPTLVPSTTTPAASTTKPVAATPTATAPTNSAATTNIAPASSVAALTATAPASGTAVAATDTRAPAPAMTATAKTSAPSPSAPPSSGNAASAALVSFDVIHLHRIGKCRGRLTVSRAGVAFLPDDKDPDDTLSLKYGEFEFNQGTDNKTLTIRKGKRNFRFTLATESTKNPTDLKIASIADAIAHNTHRGSSPASANPRPVPGAPAPPNRDAQPVSQRP